MAVGSAIVGMFLCAAGAGAVLGRGLLPLLQQQGDAAPGSFALVRYEGWLSMLWAHLICLAVSAGIVRLGSDKSIGPNAQLEIFYAGHALVGVALAISLHGSASAWPLCFAAAGKLLVDGCQALKLRRSVAYALVWAFAAACLLLNSASEGADAVYWCQYLLGADTAAGKRWLALAQTLDGFAGVAPVHFTVGVTFRYVLMRYISWALDTLSGRIAVATRPTSVHRSYSYHTASPRIGAVGGTGGTSYAAAAAARSAFDTLSMLSGPDSPQKVHPVSLAALASASWPAYLSYQLFAPAYLVGPILTAADFFQQAAAASASMPTTRKQTGGSWIKAAMRLAGCVVFIETLRRTFFTDAIVQTLLAAQPWQAWAVGYCVLAVLFAQSFVPWTFARLTASVLGITTPEEAPVGFLTSSTTPRNFWRNFHVSWYRWLCAYVYGPLGGGTTAVVASLALSTLLHGGHRAWLVWGAIQCGALLLERLLQQRKGASRLPLPPHLRTALAQCATQTTLLVQLPLGPSLPLFLACFHAVNLPFCVLNAARLSGQRSAADKLSRQQRRQGSLMPLKLAQA